MQTGHRGHVVLKTLVRWLTGQPPENPAPLSDIDQARRLIAAIDSGGIPLNPARLNQIARNLGLEVSTRAPVENTIERIRAAIQRSADQAASDHAVVISGRRD